jgi:cell division inhibitor SulA/protein ImuA
MKQVLDTILSHPRVWRGRQAALALETIPTGHPALDDILPGGGWPRTGLVEILLEHHGIGELRLLLPLLVRHGAGAPEGGVRRWLCWVAPPYVPHARALAEAGVDVDRILLVHAREDGQALWAMEQALRSEGSALVFGWVGRAKGAQLRRLQLAAEEGGALGVLFRPQAARAESSVAALRLELSSGRYGEIEVLKGRGGRPRRLPLRHVIS